MMPAFAEAKPPLHWNAPPPLSASAPLARSGSKILKGVLLGATITVGIVAAVSSLFPGGSVGAAAVSHGLDRVTNNVTQNDEIEYRAKYYSDQIFKQLGVTPRSGQKATVADFKLAASINPQMAKLYNAPGQKAADENRSSLLINGAVSAVTLIPGAGAAKQVAEVGKLAVEASRAVKIAKGAAHLIGTFASVAAGGAIANALDTKDVDPQALIEAIHLAMAQAQEKGIDPRKALTPELVFMVRVAQDAKLAEEIRTKFGEGKNGFHQLDPDRQAYVMSLYPALANAATSEAHAIATGIMPVQELGATAPNLDGRAAAYARGTDNTTFASRWGARNAATSFVDAHQARVAAAQGPAELG